MAITIQVDKYEVFKASAETITLSVYEDGDATTLSNASYVLYDNGITEKASGSITPTNNTLSVNILATHFETVRENCRIEWTFTASSVEYTFNTLFDIVSSKVCNSVVDADLLKLYPELLDDLPASRTPANFSPQIHEAFKDLKNDIRARNKDPHKMVDITPESFRKIIVHKALGIIFLNRAKEPDDLWWRLSEIHERKYRKLFENAKFPYDTNDDSVVDENHNFASIRLNR